MNKTVLYTIINLLIFVNSLQITAQIFPVQIIPQVSPPPPVYLSDYASMNTSVNRVSAQVLLTDLTVMHREIRLKLYIEGNGIKVQSRDFVIGAQPLFLDGGMPLQLGSLDLAPYFELQNLKGISSGAYANALPEGLYQFCFEAYDMLSGNIISNKSCTNVLIFLNDPPFLNFPENNINVKAVNPQNIIFQWTPRHINVSHVQYEFSLVEIWDFNMDPQAVFLSSPPLYQTTTRATSLLYGLAEPQLLEGKRYAWRIKAQAIDGIDEIGLFKNNGYSEIFSFTYQGNCAAPAYLLVDHVSSKKATFSWQGAIENVLYKIDYRKAIDEAGNTGDLNSNHWFESTSNNETFSLIDLEPDTMYEWRVGGFCADGSLSYSEPVTFTTMAQEAEAYYNCGIEPNIDITNQILLDELQIGDVIKAGDFDVKITQVNGNGSFSGNGYTTIGFLKNLKIALEFTDIQVNTDYQFIKGEIITVYDPSWSNILDIDNAIDEFTDVVDAAEDLEKILDEVFGEEEEEEESSEEDTSDDQEETNRDGDSDTSSNTNNSEESTGGGDSDASEEDASDTSSDASDSESSNEDADNDTGSDSDATDASKEVMIEHHGKLYKDGDVIEVPFNRKETNFAFLLKNYPENAKLNWKILYNDQYSTSAYAVNETVHDNLGIDMKSALFLDVIAEYNDQKIQVKIKRIPDDFKLIDVYAKTEDNKKRLAKTGETLYLLNKPDKRKIDYAVHISPKLNQNKISTYSIDWYYNSLQAQNDLKEPYGKKQIQRLLKKSDAVIKTTVDAGFFAKKQKSINVVWFGSDKEAFRYMSPDVNERVKKTFKDLEENIKILKKYIPIDEEKIKIEPIKITGSRYNEEDVNSRLYRHVEKAAVSGSITAEINKIQFTHPVLKALSKMEIVDIGLYAKFLISIGASGGVDRYKLIEHEKLENNEPYFQFTSDGCIAVGVEAKLLKAKDQIDFYVDGHAKGCLTGRIKYSFYENKMEGSIYIPPIVLEGTIKIKTSGTLKFQLIDWNDNIKVTDKIPLGKVEHTF